MPAAPSIRTLVVQPTLARYRVPVYRELASRPEIDLRLWYGDHDTLKNAEPDGFAAEERGLRVLRLGGQEFLWHQAQLDAVSAASDADVAVLSWGTRYFSLGPALRRAKRRRLPIVLWGHGYSKSESPLRRHLRDRIARYATVLMFYDADTANAAIESGWPSDRVFVAPNAIDQQPIAAARDAWLADADRLAKFQRDNDFADREVLLYVSRFSPENRVDLLVEAVDRLRRDRPSILAVLIGGGQLHDTIAQQVNERGLGDNVRLLGPVYGEDKLAPWFLSAKAFVYPSAIGLSLLHAFGYGVPVVTDDNFAGQNPEIVALQPREGPEQNGVAYRVGDADALADTLATLLDDEPLRQRLATAALATVAGRYNVPAMVDGMVAAVRRAAELAGR